MGREGGSIKLTGFTAALLLAAALLVAVAPGALGGGISDETCPNAHGENTNTCRAGTVGAPYSIRFVESEGSGCGPGRQMFLVDSGLLPPGFALTPDGTLSGTSFVSGTFRFYVEMREPEGDPTCAGKRTQKQFTLTIRRQPFVISVPARPPDAEVDVPFRMTLRARGGSGIFAWRLSAGRLPRGLELDTDGSITGTPRLAGTYRIEAEARDTESRSVTWSTTLSISPRLRIDTRQVHDARVGRSYDADLTSSAGIAPRVWRVARGRLPRGVRLAAKRGRLTGTPTELGTFRVTLEVRDRLRAIVAKRFRVVVLASRDRRRRRLP